jgi:O-antigen ligase
VNGLGFVLYLVLIASWFLHLSDRVALLGVVRFDLLLILTITTLILLHRAPALDFQEEHTGRALLALLLWVAVTFPFVEWPGSVLSFGLPRLIKVLVFYFFSVELLTTRRRLLTLLGVFLASQSFRVFEPVYLHVTQGYWGGAASMANWEFMDRLSGAPSDTVNPNGLGFVILCVFPFFHFLTGAHWLNKVAYVVVAPVLVYALILTGSRSAMVGLGAILVGIFIKSRHKLFLGALFAVAAIVAVARMPDDLRDRYLSIVSKDTKNAETAGGRLTGNVADLMVAMRKPFVGHGLGASREACAHFEGVDQLAHNLYLETAQELGFPGLLIFLYFMKSVAVNFSRSIANIKRRLRGDRTLLCVTSGMQVWLFMNILFSFASYGLSSYEWYLFGGLSVVLSRLSMRAPADAPATARSATLAPAAAT